MTPQGVVPGAVSVVGDRIAAIEFGYRRRSGVRYRSAFIAPGFIDLHVWGEPAVVGRDAAMGGATGFLTTLGPESPGALIRHVAERAHARATGGAECLGIHLEGPFVSPQRPGALPRRWMRRPGLRELTRLLHAGGGRLRLMTVAPEMPGAAQAVRWMGRHRITASLGHSTADARRARAAATAGARAVTHVFNGMRPFHHRDPSLVDVALTDDRLTAMVICDGIHVSPQAFKLLLQVKGTARTALVTDSIRRQGWDVVARRGAFYTRRGVLAGSNLTMMQAVRNAMRFGGCSLVDAVWMASEVPARLIGLERSHGALAVGKRADLVAFDERFRVRLTVVGGRVVYEG